MQVAALSRGSGIGLVSGLTGVGGGVLITPILLYCRWATGKRAAAISAIFILLNSIAALAGHFSATHNLPPGLPLFALSALAGSLAIWIACSSVWKRKRVATGSNNIDISKYGDYSNDPS